MRQGQPWLFEAPLKLRSASRPMSRSMSISTSQICAQLGNPEVLSDFQYDKDTLLPSHQAQIQKIAQCVVTSQRSRTPIRSLRLVGHTDPAGSDAYNLALGRRRAGRAQQHLRQQIEALQPGLSGRLRFIVESLGERKSTGKGAAQDRRVEVSLLRQSAPTPSPFCNPFLPPNPSGNWTNYIAAPTTGRMTPLINGRDTGGRARPKIDRVEAFEQMEQIVASLSPNDSVYLAAWQFDPRVPIINQKKLGIADWGLLFKQKACQGVKIRIIMTDFDPLSGGFKDYGGGLHGQVYKEFLPVLNQRINELPMAQRDNLKYLVSRHPATALRRTVATHHQKFMVIRRGMETIAFCGGLDISLLRTSAYWRGNNKSSTLEAWHDIHTKLEGLIARDLELEFILRWNRENKSSVVAPRPGWKAFETLTQPPVSPIDQSGDRNLHRIQMLRTVSVQGSLIPPRVQQTTRDDYWQIYKRLISCAKQFILLENQYFREIRLADELIKQAKQVPELQIIIVVPIQTDDGQDPISSHGQALQYEFFTKLAANVKPNQLRVYTMVGRFIHSKFILVDDRAMSISSANTNPRSFQMDTEVGVLTDDANVTRSFRHRLWSHNLGVPVSMVQSWAVNQFFSKWDAIAATNLPQVGRPDQLIGEGVIPFVNSVKGSRSRVIPDVLAEHEFLFD